MWERLDVYQSFTTGGLVHNSRCFVALENDRGVSKCPVDTGHFSSGGELKRKHTIHRKFFFVNKNKPTRGGRDGGGLAEPVAKGKLIKARIMGLGDPTKR